MRVWLELKDPDLEYLTLHRTTKYPRRMELRVRAKYRRAALTVEREGRQDNYEYYGGFYILASRGWIKFSGKGAGV